MRRRAQSRFFRELDRRARRRATQRIARRAEKLIEESLREEEAERPCPRCDELSMEYPVDDPVGHCLNCNWPEDEDWGASGEG